MRVIFAGVALLLLALSLTGCGREPPAPAPETPAAVTPPPAIPAESEESPAEPSTPEEPTPAATTPEPSPPEATAPETPKPATPEPPAAAANETDGIDTAYIPDDVMGAIVVRPASILGSKFIANLIAQGAPIEQELAETEQNLGIAPRNVEQSILLIDKSVTNAAEASFRDGPPQPTAILRTLEPIDQAAFLKALPGDDPEEMDADGQKYFAHESGLAIFFPDEKTIVVTSPDRVAILAAAKDVDSPLVAAMKKTSPDQDLIVLFHLETQTELLGKFAGNAGLILPPQLAGVADLPAQLKFLTVTVNVNGGSLLTVAIQGEDAKVGARAEEMVNLLVNFGKELYNTQAAQLELDLASEELRDTANELVESIAVTRVEETVTLAVKAPEGFEKLPELLAPAFAHAQAAAKGSTKKNNLKQIALGFHNYHDTFEGFPAAGKEGTEGAGLSWRVHILPFIDQAALYNKFKLDEPWDSETNKALIEEMPAIYGDLGPEMKGKTAIHLFVGEKTPFGDGTTKPKLSDIADGTSNTIMCVTAGKDKAVEWTKPGGLPFNEDNALAELGTVPDEGFLISLMDGSVRLVTKANAVKVLKLLIQHADGEVIDEF